LSQARPSKAKQNASVKAALAAASNIASSATGESTAAATATGVQPVTAGATTTTPVRKAASKAGKNRGAVVNVPAGSTAASLLHGEQIFVYVDSETSEMHSCTMRTYCEIRTPYLVPNYLSKSS
jgi:hypothetical protein